MEPVKYDGSTLLNTRSPEQKQGLSSAKHIVKGVTTPFTPKATQLQLRVASLLSLVFCQL